MKSYLLANTAKCSPGDVAIVKDALIARNCHFDIVEHPCVASQEPEPQNPPPGDDTDFVIVMGGDGTIIHAAHLMQYNQKPIVGINFGKLGYMPLSRIVV